MNVISGFKESLLGPFPYIFRQFVKCVAGRVTEPERLTASVVECRPVRLQRGASLFLGPGGLVERRVCHPVLSGAGRDGGLEQLRAVAGVTRFGLDATSETEHDAALETKAECLTVLRVMRTTNSLGFSCLDGRNRCYIALQCCL